MTDQDTSPEAVERLKTQRDQEDTSPRGCKATMQTYPCSNDCPCALRDQVIALSAALEAERGWQTVAESNQQMAQSWQARAEAAESERDALKAELAEAVEVSRPFAKFSEQYPNAKPDVECVSIHDPDARIVMGDFHRSRAFLARHQKEKDT